MRDVIHTIDDASSRRIVTVGKITEEQVPGREYKMIDFYLPGMIGFSMIRSCRIRSCILVFNLRESLVLKDYNASPVNRKILS